MTRDQTSKSMQCIQPIARCSN